MHKRRAILMFMACAALGISGQARAADEISVHYSPD